MDQVLRILKFSEMSSTKGQSARRTEKSHFRRRVLCIQIKYFMNFMFSALKHSERRAFLCRQSFDAEHSSGYNYGQFSAPGDECKVKLDEVGRFLIITSNGMPDHDHNTRNLRPQRIEISIPKHPTLLSVSEKKHFMVEHRCRGCRLVSLLSTL